MTELRQMLFTRLVHAQDELVIEAVFHWDGPGWYAAYRLNDRDIYTRIGVDRSHEPDAFAMGLQPAEWYNWVPFWATKH